MTRDVGCSLRMFKREVVSAVPFFKNFHRFFPFLARVAGFTVIEIPLAHAPRRYGHSKYNNTQRALEGLFDLIGVFWLKKRMVKHEYTHQS